jgi:fatty acid desaturase
MAFACNIDRRGQRIRRIRGVFALVLGIILLFFALYGGPWWLWIPGLSAAAGGLFGLFEAQKKWCALRALGIKTRL